MRSSVILFLTVAGTCVLVGAQQAGRKSANQRKNEISQQLSMSQTPALKMPGPEVQNFMLGTWSISVNYEPSKETPNGGVGYGTEVWRPGPGGLSVIEEYHEKNANGEVDGLGVAWWDKTALGQRFVWCDMRQHHSRRLLRFQERRPMEGRKAGLE